jgi:PAS domain-containing protein
VTVRILEDDDEHENEDDDFSTVRAGEQRLQDIIDNTTAVIFVKDLQLRYLLVNREYERRYRVRGEDIRGKSDFDIHPRKVAGAVTLATLIRYRSNERLVIT